MLDASLVVGTSSVVVLVLQDFKYDIKCSDRAFGVLKHDADNDSCREEITAIKFWRWFLAESLELPVLTISLKKFHKSL